MGQWSWVCDLPPSFLQGGIRAKRTPLVEPSLQLGGVLRRAHPEPLTHMREGVDLNLNCDESELGVWFGQFSTGVLKNRVYLETGRAYIKNRAHIKTGGAFLRSL